MIRRSGENLSAAEVETVLAAHPGVITSAVLAEPDDLRGEEVHAVLVLDEQTPAVVRSLQRFCAERLASFKVATGRSSRPCPGRRRNGWRSLPSVRRWRRCPRLDDRPRPMTTPDG
jgi:carnitine-CoA ligase